MEEFPRLADQAGAGRYQVMRSATSTRKPRGERSTAANAKGALLQASTAHTGATQAQPNANPLPSNHGEAWLSWKSLHPKTEAGKTTAHNVAVFG